MIPNTAVVANRQADPADPADPDFFPTPPWGARAGAELVKRLDPRARSVWEPACGAGHMVHGLKDYFPRLVASDAYAYDGNAICDFLDPAESYPGMVDWVITNPPFKLAQPFVRRAWSVASRGVAMLLRVGFLESAGRYGLLYGGDPGLTLWSPFIERLPMTEGRWEPDASSATFYAWFFWLKPQLRPERFMARIGGELRPGTEPIPPGTETRLTHPDDARLFGAVDRSRT
ncbi:MAG: hypothetical protein JF588_19315 [Caulobacterales bacterium]|nr:hypothetical protein [Caulobacterales bacterium]